MEKTLNTINRETWLFILSELNLSYEEYWYSRGMLDIMLPENETSKLGNNPLIDYLHKIKVNKKGEKTNG